MRPPSSLLFTVLCSQGCFIFKIMPLKLHENTCQYIYLYTNDACSLETRQSFFFLSLHGSGLTFLIFKGQPPRESETRKKFFEIGANTFFSKRHLGMNLLVFRKPVRFDLWLRRSGAICKRKRTTRPWSSFFSDCWLCSALLSLSAPVHRMSSMCLSSTYLPEQGVLAALAGARLAASMVVWRDSVDFSACWSFVSFCLRFVVALTSYHFTLNITVSCSAGCVVCLFRGGGVNSVKMYNHA